ncbi:uncharacterized protein LY79DRAFT_571516 [Colletotrichum navitas]|uniref:Secreted protein n=1 Tax=Colletotrichum navitas TaxID=681940 RepID=A0AAD8PLW8_9PEZI|nr:uncharacterized protein LY79DRAFT_571516 [Colletotrichum navitas]KAK1569637.1 hypothetical protein LY79DRAFT_571516 [Colletotrichum navitas]
MHHLDLRVLQPHQVGGSFLCSCLVLFLCLLVHAEDGVIIGAALLLNSFSTGRSTRGGDVGIAWGWHDEDDGAGGVRGARAAGVGNRDLRPRSGI